MVKLSHIPLVWFSKTRLTVLQCHNGTILHKESSILKSVLQGMIYKLSQGKGQGRTRGTGPGMRAGDGNLSRQNPPPYGPAENPGANITKLLLSV